MALLRPSSRSRASADLGYRLFAGLVAGGAAELLGVVWAQDRNPHQPDYLTPSLVAAGVGLLTAILDPPDGSDDCSSSDDEATWRSGWWLSPDGRLTEVPHASTHTDVALSTIAPGPYSDEEVRRHGCENPNGTQNPSAQGCTAMLTLQEEGYVRIHDDFMVLAVQLFAPLTPQQRSVLGPLVAKCDKELLVEGMNSGFNQYVTPGLAGPRLRALDEASAAA